MGNADSFSCGYPPMKNRQLLKRSCLLTSADLGCSMLEQHLGIFYSLSLFFSTLILFSSILFHSFLGSSFFSFPLVGSFVFSFFVDLSFWPFNLFLFFIPSLF